MDRYIKDPAAVLDYVFDFRPLAHARPGAVSDYLETGETITDHEVTATSGLTVDSTSEDDGAVTVWLSGGTVHQTYTVDCTIVTSAGRTDSRSIEIECKDR